MLFEYESVYEYEDAQGGIDGIDMGTATYDASSMEIDLALAEIIGLEYHLPKDKLYNFLRDFDFGEDLAYNYYDELKEYFEDKAN